MRIVIAAAILALVLPAAARAQGREFCADRPGLGTPPCTLAPGEAMVEVGAAEWEHMVDADSIENQTTLGDVLLRIGFAQSAEVQFGLTSHVTDRTRDRGDGMFGRQRGVGDATIALRRGLAGPNGPIALQAFVTVPVGDNGDGMGRVAGGLLLPAQAQLPAGFELAITPQIDLAANEEERGRHLIWGGVAGLDHALVTDLDATIELSAFRDDDPSGHATDARVAGSLAWQAGKRFQLDVELDLGLTSGAPDRVIALGLARRFR